MIAILYLHSIVVLEANGSIKAVSKI